MKKICFTFFACFLSFSLFAQSHFSLQGHDGNVTTITPDMGSEKTFFSTGNDGFVIKWGDNGEGEHYQVSELPIKLSALSPDGKTLALYETDGSLINRLSVWDFSTLKRKYAKRFSDTITTLTFSAQGTYIIAGTTAVNGTIFLKSSDGSIVSKLKDATGISTFVNTSASEKTTVTYSPQGFISYFTMQTGKLKNKLQTEDSLSNIVMFCSNMFLCGTKNNTIYIISALSGKSLLKIPSSSPIIISSAQDTNLYYIEKNGKNYSLKEVQNNENKTFSTPVTLKTFSALESGTICSASKSGSDILIGSTSGRLYKTETLFEGDVTNLLQISENVYEKIFDIAKAPEGEFYFLSETALYKSSYETGVVNKLFDNQNYTNITSYEDGLIFWKQNSKHEALYFNPITKNVNQLFTPKQNIQMLKVFQNTIYTLEGNATINSYDFQTKKKTELYQGASLQDFTLMNDIIYVAKTAATSPQVPLIGVNSKTKEISPLRVNGDIVYSLSSTYDTLYGVAIENISASKITKLFSYTPKTNASSTVLRLQDEDAYAFTYIYEKDVFTNIGRSKVYSCNTQTKKNTQYERSSSIPLKVVQNMERLASLNKDGSISWYTLGKNNVLADWYLTKDGSWFEF
ncbi:MAG: hypothetical protein IKI31_02925 [Treponema sp.]|nr:hypothetical protein [Treponema sp.]